MSIFNCMPTEVLDEPVLRKFEQTVQEISCSFVEERYVASTVLPFVEARCVACVYYVAYHEARYVAGTTLPLVGSRHVACTMLPL